MQYYADVAPLLVPYVTDRAMVLKRYPNGIDPDFFYMKRTPNGAPPWLRRARSNTFRRRDRFSDRRRPGGSALDDQSRCIDLNEWYSRCDYTDRPDYLQFDLDPVEGTPFATVREVALRVRDGLEGLGMKPVVKTTGSSGMHVYVASCADRCKKKLDVCRKHSRKRSKKCIPTL